MTSIVLRQDQLGPQLFDDPMREIIVLEQVYLLSYLALIKVPIKSSQTGADLGSLPRQFSLKYSPLFGLHEIYYFLGGNFRAVDIEGIAHRVLADEVEDLHPFDAVLLIDEEV